jgi:hypothetical protein
VQLCLQGSGQGSSTFETLQIVLNAAAGCKLRRENNEKLLHHCVQLSLQDSGIKSSIETLHVVATAGC